MTSRLLSIESGTSAQTIAKMLRVLFPDARTVLDMTYGSGKFWSGYEAVSVTGIDLDPSRARDICADFTRLPFRDGAFDLAIFDPPYLSNCSKKGTSQIGQHFSSFPSLDALRDAVCLGASEAWRVSRLGVITKVQNYSHSGQFVRMTRWVEDAIPKGPCGEIHTANLNKVIGSSWGQQLSVYSVHTTYLAFRHRGVVRGLIDRARAAAPVQPELFEESVG